MAAWLRWFGLPGIVLVRIYFIRNHPDKLFKAPVGQYQYSQYNLRGSQCELALTGELLHNFSKNITIVLKSVCKIGWCGLQKILPGDFALQSKQIADQWIKASRLMSQGTLSSIQLWNNGACYSAIYVWWRSISVQGWTDSTVTPLLSISQCLNPFQGALPTTNVASLHTVHN